uniref:Uncharacterized protein n=1 Tax=Scleropages formosus TaxID=113540 RepID=A0A8C9VMX4_SCLFO
MAKTAGKCCWRLLILNDIVTCGGRNFVIIILCLYFKYYITLEKKTLLLAAQTDHVCHQKSKFLMRQRSGCLYELDLSLNQVNQLENYIQALPPQLLSLIPSTALKTFDVEDNHLTDVLLHSTGTLLLLLIST